MRTILSIKNLTVSIPLGNRKVVNDVSFNVNEGEIVVLAGANGCGKSTILKTIVRDAGKDGIGLDGLTISGEVSLEGSKNVLQYTHSQLINNLSKRIGYVMQKDDYEEKARGTTVADCIIQSAEEFIPSKKLTMHEVNEILIEYAPQKESKGKSQFEANSKVRVPFLSGGQQRLLSIISNIAVRESAPLFLIDEPLNNLDSDNMIYVSNLINSIHLKNPKAAFLIVTHCRIFPFVTRRIEMLNGRIMSITEDCGYYDCVGKAKLDGFFELPE